MPLIALALLLDLAGLGGTVWWLSGQSLQLLLDVAHFTAGQPGAVKLMPQMAGWTFAAFVAGGLWLALWQGRHRLWGLAPAAVAMLALLAAPVPDLLISGDGQHVGIAGEGDRLLVLREGRSSFARDNLLELAGMKGEPIALQNWPEAQCNRDFCSLEIKRGGRRWSVLMTRSRSRIAERALAAACDCADVVIADRWLPRSCRPRWLKADRNYLDGNGGLALYLVDRRIVTVAQGQGDHPWWTARQVSRPTRLVVAPK
jgi:competence protein ComEC